MITRPSCWYVQNDRRRKIWRRRWTYSCTSRLMKKLSCTEKKICFEGSRGSVPGMFRKCNAYVCAHRARRLLTRYFGQLLEFQPNETTYHFQHNPEIALKKSPRSESSNIWTNYKIIWHEQVPKHVALANENIRTVTTNFIYIEKILFMRTMSYSKKL